MSVEQIKDKILSLQQALENRLPGMQTVLKDIYDHMKKDPEVVTILEDSEIALVVEGLKRHANLEIPVSKQSSAKAKRQPVTAADL
ncbi:hypothetical protein [Candidatus Macondimonas diazotrophica]|jgi:hypothetical protein|uniref:Uncharacterized protein n=1 Tax=Candidatus Macondimonas diazotrophica TaxID=2305248 RepID=A0A4Z0F7L9_9GAMM|nr:hypothetical protein [Candidatus Macondimonas diazotrophica]TFZ81675.1 hypothetical protein E4680_11435 [Candidatus Macondimonas diazotrophica]